ncbi:hypothetical protein D3C76_831890 [compost metagenome]
MTNLVDVILNFDQNAHILHVFYNLLTAFTAIKSLILAGSRIHRSALIHHSDLRQIVAKTYFKVVRIMCRCNFNRTAAEFLLYVFVADDRNFASDDRKNQCLANQVTVTFILRMNSYRCITKHRLRTRCSNRNISVAILERVLKMIQMAINLFVFNFNIRECCTGSRVPVNDILAAIDQAFFIQLYKHFTNGIRQTLVKCKTFTGIVK